MSMSDRLAKLRDRKLCEPLLVVAMYVGLAVWSTWPMAQQATSSLPRGASPGAAVPLFNLWTLWWNSAWFNSVDHGPVEAGYWNAPIFHPSENSFAYSEPQPTSIVVAPVIWLTGSSVLAYNLFLLLSLVLNGVLAWRLLKFLRVHRFVAAGGGAAMLLLPIVHYQRDVLQLIPVWGILWTWLALAKFGREASWQRGTEAGAAFAITFLMCGHHGLFLSVLLAGAAWILPRHWRSRKTWAGILAGVAIAAVLAGPVIFKLKTSLSDSYFNRKPRTVARLSAKPFDYTATYGGQLIRLGSKVEKRRRLSPGTLKYALALIGIGFGLARRRWRRWTLFLMATGGLAFALSLGANLNIFGWKVWETLTESVSGFSQVRSVFRFAWFVQIAVVLLAAQGLHWLVVLGNLLHRHRDSERVQALRANLEFLARMVLRGKERRRFERRSRLGTRGTLFCLGALLIIETLPKRVELAATPDLEKNTGWLEFVRDETQPGKAILCVPMAASNKVSDFEVTTRWMFFQTAHGKAMINGYSGFFPRHSFDKRRAGWRGVLTDETLVLLARQDVDLIVADRRKFPRTDFDLASLETPGVVRVFEDPQAEIDVYRIVTE